MLAIGNDELGKKLGKLIDCPHCGKRHRVQHSEPGKTYHPDGTVSKCPGGQLQFYVCDGFTYLCGIQGRAIRRMIGET